MKIKIKNLHSILIMFFTLFSFFCITYFCTKGSIGRLIAFAIFLVICCMILYELNSSREYSTILSIPILLSVFQNAYLGFFSLHLNSSTVQILTVLNFVIACLIFVYLIILKNELLKINNKYILMFILLIGYSALSVILLNEFNILSIISSLRNIISVFLFYLIGFYSKDRVNQEKFEDIILMFALIVMTVGIIDILTGGNMWIKLNIKDLWTKKGIRVQSTGLPTNFYSSETINGQRIRRMTSTFADPVNLGAFLFATFCIAWHRKRKNMMCFLIVGMILTVSKGAWLGLLIFFCIYSYYYLPRTTFLLILIFSGSLGIGFLLYAFHTSANSVFLHISGLFSSFKGLIYKPIGSGIGSNGVLAKQFSGVSANADVTETGLGMIISQLGIVGLLIYMIYFAKLYRKCTFLKNKKDLVLTLSLLFSVIVNIFFNEVALSPNTCAIYFLIIGFISNDKFKLVMMNDRK